MITVRDMKLARFAKKNGAKSALRTRLESKKNGIPFSWALALIEQESEWKNIFGCDHGPGRAHCHEPVTNEKVRELMALGLYNGVGYTQLTSPGYVRRAMNMRGGAASVKNQIIVGMEVFREKTGGDMDNAWKYNGATSYQRQIAYKADRWHERLKRAGLA